MYFFLVRLFICLFMLLLLLLLILFGCYPVLSVLLKHITVLHLSSDKLAENFENSTLGMELKLLAMAQVRAMYMASSHWQKCCVNARMCVIRNDILCLLWWRKLHWRFGVNWKTFIVEWQYILYLTHFCYHFTFFSLLFLCCEEQTQANRCIQS